MAFYIGQKVVCVDASKNDGKVWFQAPIEKEIYTVRRTCIYTTTGEAGLKFYEIENFNDHPFKAYRFRPIVAKPTFIYIFTAMLGPKQKERIDG